MTIYVGLNIYSMRIYEMHINLSRFAVKISVSLHMILYVIDISLMNYLRYNVQYNI